MTKPTLDERLDSYRREERGKEKSSSKLLLAASAATSVGAILIPPPAEAAIVYSGLRNKVVSIAQSQQQVDLNGDGVFEFTFDVWAFAPYTYSQTVNGAASMIMSNNGNPANLQSNYMVSSRKEFSPVQSDDLAVYQSSVAYGGNFSGRQGFLGIRFEVEGNTHYGWIQYKTNEMASVGTIVDWAYEDTPDTEIKTGDTGVKFNWNLFLPAIMAAGNKK